VRLLFDSHVALWWLAGDPSVSARCQQTVSDADEVFVSAVTPWELGIKRSLGKVDYPADLVATLRRSGFRMLSVAADHAELAPVLPPHHRDPFDRMLVAQARLESLVLVTADASLLPYDVEIIDPRR
jgi:PIN domain nuclease of toxin-antitoxin system